MLHGFPAVTEVFVVISTRNRSCLLLYTIKFVTWIDKGRYSSCVDGR